LAAWEIWISPRRQGAKSGPSLAEKTCGKKSSGTLTKE
jgi:hypothetical protein